MNLDRAIADAPRWMFLLILIYAPWAYGSTYTLTISILNQFSAALVVLWLAGCAWRGRWPRVPWLPVALVALLLLHGWWLAWNAHSVHGYRTWTTVNRLWDNPPLPGWPGAIDRRLAQTSMLNVTALFALFLFACDLMTRPEWRKRVWSTLVVTALSVAVGGTILKLGGPGLRELVWDAKVAQLPTTFATYRYHGNAASLMSIGWALALGFTIAAAGRRGQPLALAGWVLALLGLLVGLFINNSRAGWGLAVLLALFVGARFLRSWWQTARGHFDWRQGLVQGAVLASVVGGLLFVTMSSDWQQKLTRFHTTVETIQERYPRESITSWRRRPDCWATARTASRWPCRCIWRPSAWRTRNTASGGTRTTTTTSIWPTGAGAARACGWCSSAVALRGGCGPISACPSPGAARNGRWAFVAARRCSASCSTRSGTSRSKRPRSSSTS